MYFKLQRRALVAKRVDLVFFGAAMQGSNIAYHAGQRGYRLAAVLH